MWLQAKGADLALFCVAGDMDQYLHYIGGPAGALALTGVAAASAYYLASRPTPEKPLVPLDDQSYLVPVSQISSFFLVISKNKLQSFFGDFSFQSNCFVCNRVLKIFHFFFN
jgi:hypothetical protein